MRGIELAFIPKVRRQNFGVPTLTGRDFDHYHVVFDIKKGQGFFWMTILVTVFLFSVDRCLPLDDFL